MKKNRVAIGLVISLLLLVGLAYWDELQTKKDEAHKASENLIFSLKAEDVVKVTYDETKTGTKFELTRGESDWSLSSPTVAPADKTVIDGFLKTLLEYKSEKLVADSKDRWADFGVAEPQRVIALTDKSGKTEKVFVGNQAPVGYSAFFRTDDSGKVFVGSQYIITSTGKTAQEFRDKKITDLDSANVKTFRYVVGGEQIFVAEQKDGKFAITLPTGIDSDSSEISSFIGEIGRAKAEDFSEQATPAFAKSFGESKASFGLEWTDASGPHNWQVAASGSDFWVKTDASPTYYKISADTVKSLRKELKDFRNRQIASYETADVVKVEVDGRIFDKMGDGFVSPDTKDPQVHIQNLISDIAWSKAENFVADDSPDVKVITTPPTHRITITFDEKAKRSSLQLDAWTSAKDANKFVVKSSDAKSLLIVGRDVLANVKQQDPGMAPPPKEEGGT